MSFIIISISALLASALTMFSGFGLSTLIMPVFAVFMPLDIAVAATALVHAVNNIFKVILLGKFADFKVVLKFGLPAVAAAFLGAAMLAVISHTHEIVQYNVLGKTAVITPIKLLLGLLILFFAFFELLPRFQKLSFDRKYLPIGGILSGFFGGLSGHQGALRSAFLAKTDISAQAFVGTNAVIALMVDGIRIAVYGALILSPQILSLSGSHEGRLIAVGTLAAFAGVVLGKKLLHKVTMKTIQIITGILLLMIGALLTSGIV